MRRWPTPSTFLYCRTVHYVTPLANWATFSRIHGDGDLRIPSSDHSTVTLFIEPKEAHDCIFSFLERKYGNPCGKWRYAGEL
jgi:hypothetical protein